MHQVADWAADINYCIQEGILKGIGNNLVAPLNNTTREQAICFVERVGASFSAQSPETNAPVNDEITQFEEEVVRLVNIERANAGEKPLNHNVNLSDVARTKSQDMVDKNYFSHTSPTYGSPFDMIKSLGFIMVMLVKTSQWDKLLPMM